MLDSNNTREMTSPTNDLFDYVLEESKTDFWRQLLMILKNRWGIRSLWEYSNMCNTTWCDGTSGYQEAQPRRKSVTFRVNHIYICAVNTWISRTWTVDWNEFSGYIPCSFERYLKCHCDENFVFSFPVFLALISYLDPSLLESVKFSTS